MAKKKTITIQDINVTLITENNDEYISLTDIAKKFGEPRIVIQNWMRRRNTLEFLGVWENLHNPNFNRIEFDAFLFESGSNSFSMSPSKWIKNTNAIGIKSKAGRYGGTYAYKDMALGFCYWLSPPFQVYVIKEFQRLKIIEAQEQQEALEWNLKRVLSKINYTVHTDAIKENLIPPRLKPKSQGFVYASEADILNMAVFGMTAKQWRLQYPEAKGNIRDNATHLQLLVLSNLEAVNAELIRINLSQDERLSILNEAAIKQMTSLLTAPSLLKLGLGRGKLP